MLPDDDKRYAIETCRSSESVLKKWFKNKWHTISALVGCVIISNNYLLRNNPEERSSYLFHREKFRLQYFGLLYVLNMLWNSSV